MGRNFPRGVQQTVARRLQRVDSLRMKTRRNFCVGAKIDKMHEYTVNLSLDSEQPRIDAALFLKPFLLLSLPAINPTAHKRISLQSN